MEFDNLFIELVLRNAELKDLLEKNIKESIANVNWKNVTKGLEKDSIEYIRTLLFESGDEIIDFDVVREVFADAIERATTEMASKLVFTAHIERKKKKPAKAKRKR